MEKTYLFSTWVLYLLIHSLLVSDWMKKTAADYLGLSKQQTRKATSLVSLLLITSLLQYHFYVYSPTLYTLGLVYRLVGMASMALGIVFVIKYVSTLVYPPQPFEASTITTAGGKSYVKSFINGNFISRERNPGYIGALLFALGFPLYFTTLINVVCATMAAVYVLAKLIYEDKKRLQLKQALEIKQEENAATVEVPLSVENTVRGNSAVVASTSPLPANRPQKLRVHKMIPYTKRRVS